MDGGTGSEGRTGAAARSAAGPTIGTAFDPRQNNFDLIRLFAALLVLISHCYPLTGVSREPFAAFLGEYDTGGGWGVSIFFVISGFLVTRSVLERPTGIYFRSRVLRIVPALALVTLFEAFVVGPMFSTASISAYLSDPLTFAHLRNISVFWLDGGLPGVFADNPYPREMNGSIWTLPIESAFYVMLPILAAVGLLRPRWIIVLLAVTSGWLAYGMLAAGWDWGNPGPRLFVGGPAYIVFKEAMYFLIGGCLWVHRDRIPFSGGLAVACLILLLIFAFQDYRFVAMAIALPYLVIYAALAKPFHVAQYDKVGDLSYGTYLFAFPVQQCLVATFEAARDPLALALMAVPVTLVLAALSWYLVERPALALRHGRRI